MAAQVVMEYPNYSSSGSDGLASYLVRAQAIGVHPIFTTMLSLREDCLSAADKNIFIDMYCAIFTDFMRQMRGSYDQRYPDPPASREVESVAYYDPDEPTQYQRHPYGAPPQSTVVVGESRPLASEYQYGKVNDDRDPSDDEYGGSKSRRRSNRKSSRSNRKNRSRR
jgi:hypothetical protein